jgi:peptide chain release factor 2
VISKAAERHRWGSQFPQRLFMPISLVKDHHTGFETATSTRDDGDLDGFINAY